MESFVLKVLQSKLGLLSLAIVGTVILLNTNVNGLFGESIEFGWLWMSIYIVVLTHICITSMSLSFHRFHTHKGVIIKRRVDYLMQITLWLVTGMNKSDWVSVHMFHHANSDKPKDPHSPVQKGFWHVLLFGAIDYVEAKNSKDVVAIADRLPMSIFEVFLKDNMALGIIIMSVINFALFGLQWGWTFNIINYLISPIFAVGGVNTLAHWFGYRNHKSGDNSRNLGFVFPLNFMICGELDHNNHHGHQKSCSFRHKWYEFDIGYVYIKLLSYMKLAKIKNVYNPSKMKEDLARRVAKMIEKNQEFQAQLEALGKELDMSVQEMKEQIISYMDGKKVKLEKPLLEFKKEVIRLVKESYHHEISFA